MEGESVYLWERKERIIYREREMVWTAELVHPSPIYHSVYAASGLERSDIEYQYFLCGAMSTRM